MKTILAALDKWGFYLNFFFYFSEESLGLHRIKDIEEHFF